MSRLAAIAQQLQQTAQLKEQLDVQKRELEEAVQAGTIAVLAVSVQETKNVPTADLRVWVEPAEACRGQASFDTTLKQEVVFQLVSNEGKIFFSYIENDNLGPKLELGIEELPDGQILMAWLKPEKKGDDEAEDEAEVEAEAETEGETVAAEVPKMEIRAEYDSVEQKLMTLQRKLQQAEDNQTALQQQLKQFQSASAAAPAVEDVEDVEEDEEQRAGERQAATRQQTTPKGSHQRQRSRARRAAAAEEEEEEKSALHSAWQFAQLAGGLLFQHSAVFIFIGSAVAMHLYGDYASV